jgi:Rrf2 family protein
MRFTAQEEYSLRCLLQIASQDGLDGLTIPEISQREGLSQHQVAKVLRQMRIHGFIESSRGKHGGYLLARPPEAINVRDVLNAIGGKLYDSEFCSRHAGEQSVCRNIPHCNVRLVWHTAQEVLDSVFEKITLAQLSDTHAIQKITSAVRKQANQAAAT